MPLKLRHAQLSDLGMRRGNNQDSVTSTITSDLAIWQRRGHLLMVADGMGAHAAGELASKLAVDNVPHAYYKSAHASPAAALRHAVREANEVIHSKGQDSLDFQGMGTTCTCLAIVPQGALVAHVGDSRAYRLRENTFEQLSFDHSLVWEAAAAGHLPEDSLAAVLPKNVITRSLGPHPTVNVDLEGPYDVQPGDVFLVCSDGLSNQVSDEELGTIIGLLPPEEAAQVLVDLSNLRGGPDNITLNLAMVEQQTESGDACTIHPNCKPGRTVPGWVWVALGASIAVLAAAAIAQSVAWAVLGAAGLGFSVGVVAVRKFGPDRLAHGILPLAGPFGNGPYRKFDCTPAKPVSDTLAFLAGELRNLANGDDWPVEMQWASIDIHQKTADTAAGKEDFATSIAEYCQVIRLTMQQLRERRSTVTTQVNIQIDKPGEPSEDKPPTGSS